MIIRGEGNLLTADAEALVNTVNCVGFMGKGIALQFKQAFPRNFEAYQIACKQSEVKPGKMFTFETGSFLNPRYIINFPTKRHWRGKSRIADIEQGLESLVDEIIRLKIGSIAIPPLGSGLGGLDWNNVKPLIENALGKIPNLKVLLFSPQSSPKPKDMPINTEKPKLTIARALFIKLMDQYATLDYRQTLLEIQKLAYFLQESGEPLRLNFQKGKYGPYAHNLNKVLQILEGHFIRGVGDRQNPDAEIELVPGSVEEADEFLSDKHDSNERLSRVADLIAGFETPYGMELLSSVHWVCKYNDPPATNKKTAVGNIRRWNDRKKNLFQEKHIHVAWDRLNCSEL